MTTVKLRVDWFGMVIHQLKVRRRSAFWLGRKTQKFSGTNQKPERRRPFGTGLVRHCPQGLFSPFFTFLRVTFFRPFRLSLAPTICPWVSEDGIGDKYYSLSELLVVRGLSNETITFCFISLFSILWQRNRLDDQHYKLWSATVR